MAARSIPQQELIALGISRVSLIKQVDNYSLEAQQNKLAALEQKFGFRIPDGFLIDDEGYSGTDFNRPSIKDALRRIRRGEANAVVFPHLDRFARNVEGGLHTIRQFREAGAQVLLGDYGWVTDEKHFKIQMQLGLMVAEWQRDDIADKSRSGIETKLRRGLAFGGRSRYGWHFVSAEELAAEAIRNGQAPATGKAQNVHRPVPEHLANVILMGKLALAGHSLNSICRELLSRGIPSPSGAAKWNPTTVREILKDPVYHTGIWHWGKHRNVAPKKMRKMIDRHQVKSSRIARPESDWIGQKLEGAPIISEATHRAILEALERNGKASVGKPAAADGYEALLKSLVVCDACGYAVIPKQQSTPKGRRCWYVCSHNDRTTGKRLCTAAQHMPAEILEEVIYNSTGEALIVELDGLVSRYRTQIIANVDTEDLAKLKAQEQKLERHLRDARDRELEADTDTAEGKEERKYYTAKIAEYKGQLALLRRRLQSVTDEADIIDVDTAAISREVKASFQTKVRSERRELLKGWVHKVRWAGDHAEITLRIPLRQTGVNYKAQQGAIRVHRAGTSSSPSAAFQCDRASHRPARPGFPLQGKTGKGEIRLPCCRRQFENGIAHAHSRYR
jgi:site-specific DNA recombinase